MSIVALKEAIQQLVKQQLNSANLCDYSLGVVETINPLTIRIDQQLAENLQLTVLLFHLLFYLLYYKSVHFLDI